VEDRRENVLLAISDHPDPTTLRGPEEFEYFVDDLFLRGQGIVETHPHDGLKKRRDTEGLEHLVGEVHPLGGRDGQADITLVEHPQRLKDAVIEPGLLDTQSPVVVAVPFDCRLECVPDEAQTTKGLLQGRSDEVAQLVVTARDAKLVERKTKRVKDSFLRIGNGSVEVEDHVVGKRTHRSIIARLTDTGTAL